jgi:hypothetical protein
MIKNKITFETYREPASEDQEKGEAFKLSVRRPSPKEQSESDRIYNKAFREAKDAGAYLRLRVNEMVRDELWSDEKSAELDRIDNEIGKLSKALLIKKLDNKPITKLDGRDIALKLRGLRGERLMLLAPQNAMDEMTCEAQADNKRFNFYVSKCTVDPVNNDPYFASLEDYENRSHETASVDAARNLATLLYGNIIDFQMELPENKYLLKYGYCNKDLHLINDKGDLCDAKFRRVDSDGFLVNGDGVRVDDSGNPIELEEVPFDDEVSVDSSVENEATEV